MMFVNERHGSRHRELPRASTFARIGTEQSAVGLISDNFPAGCISDEDVPRWRHDHRRGEGEEYGIRFFKSGRVDRDY
jgi:hypothetical protein